MTQTAQPRFAFLPLVALLAAVFLWGSSFIAIKIAFTEFNPLFVIFARMAIASIIFLFFYKKFRNIPYRKGDWKYIAGMALFEPCFYFVFESYALTYTSASQAGMVVATLPLITAVVAYFVFKERLTPRILTGFFMSIAGVIWLTLSSKVTASAPNPILGNTLELLAMCSATCYFIFLKKLLGRYNSWFLTAMQAFIGAIFFFPAIFLPVGTPPTDLPFTPSVAVLYLAIFVTIGAYGSYNYAVTHFPVSQASAFTNLIPLVTVVLGWLVLGEEFTPMQYPASGLILLGVFFSQNRSKKKNEKS